MVAEGQRWVWSGQLRLMAGVHRNTVTAWIKRGVLPKPVRVSGRNAWAVGAVEQFLKSGGSTASPEGRVSR